MALGTPDAGVAVERDGGVEVVDEVVVLGEERDGEGGSADDMCGAEAVVAGEGGVGSVGEVVEGPGEGGDREAGGDEDEEYDLPDVA